MKFDITHGGETVRCEAGEVDATCQRLVAKHGDWVAGVSKVSPANSDWGNIVMDERAAERIEGQHQALRDSGIEVDSSQQLYKTGTRMADGGYATQHERAAEHARKMPLAVAVEQLSKLVIDEHREDIEITAGQFADGLSVNGSVRFNGLKIREQTVRGLLGRIESPALHYVQGLRDRVLGTDDKIVAKMDAEQIVEVLQHECKRFHDVKLKLRTRKGLQDVFACVSPRYGNADAPEVLAEVIENLPADAKASFEYDPVTTSWQLQADVFTPTPVEQQAVGEAFRGYLSFRGKDNGTGRLFGDGGIDFLRCLNASLYAAASREVSRVHRGRVMVDLDKMIVAAGQAIHTLVRAWGIASNEVVVRPNDDSGKLIPLEQAIPGFFRHMLTARRGELLGVLPGRTEKHVEQLAAVFPQERRNQQQLVRGDFGQSFTKYVQTQPLTTRLEAQAAIAQWVVKQEPMQYLPA